MPLVIIFILITLFFYIRHEKKFLLYIPVVYLFSSFLYPLITDVNSSIEPAANSSTIVLKIFLTGLMFFIAVKTILKAYISKVAKITLLFITYLFILSLFSDDLTTVWTRILVVGSNMLLLPASITFFSKKSKRILFLKLLGTINVLAILYIIYASIFKVGAVIYDNELVRYGGFHFFGLYLFVFSFPIFLQRVSNKFSLYFLLLVVAQIAILVLSLKRTYIVFVGLFLIIFLISLFLQKKIKVSGFFIIGAAVLSLIYFSNTVSEAQSSREKDLSSESLEEEGRILEYYIYYDERIINVSYKTFFGENPFNNRGEYGINNKYSMNTRDRTLHSDYTTILFGAGILGLILLLLFYYQILKILKKMWQAMNKLNLDKSYIYLSLSYVIVLLISQAIDGLYVFWARGIPYMILGYLIAYNMSLIKKKSKVSVKKH